MALTFIHNKKIQEIFKDEQCSGKLSIDSSKNIGENGKDGKNKSSLYFSNIEIDNSYNKETILKALDENVIISTNEKMSREYVIGDLIMTPKLDIFCVVESKNDNHKFDLKQYGKIINENRTEYTDLRDSIITVELKDISTDVHVCPAPVNRSMEASINKSSIVVSTSNPHEIGRKSNSVFYYDDSVGIRDFGHDTNELLDAWVIEKYNFIGFTDTNIQQNPNLDTINKSASNTMVSSEQHYAKKHDIVVYIKEITGYHEYEYVNMYEWDSRWKLSNSAVFTKHDKINQHNHFVDDSTYIFINDSSHMTIQDSSNILYYRPSPMIYNYYTNKHRKNCSPYDSTLNFDSSSKIDTSLFINYQNANRQMYGLKFKPTIHLNPINIMINLEDYEFALRIGLKNNKKYGCDNSYSYYLDKNPDEAFLKNSPYDENNSVESIFFKNLYIPLNKIIDDGSSNENEEEMFLSDVTMDRFHLFNNEYQSNVINTNMTSGVRKCSFIHNGTTYATRIFGSTDKKGYTPINIKSVNNKPYIKSNFYLNDTYYHYPYNINGRVFKANTESGYDSACCFIQRPIRKIANKKTINYRSGESVYFSSIVPTDSSGWCDDYRDLVLPAVYNIYQNPRDIYESQVFKLNKFDDYVLLSHLSNPNNDTSTYANTKIKASNQIGLLVGQEMVKFLFNNDNEYELICTNTKTGQVYYVDLKNDYFKNRFIKNIPLILTDFYYNNFFNPIIHYDLYIPSTYLPTLIANDDTDSSNGNNDNSNNNNTPSSPYVLPWQQNINHQKQTYTK